LFVGVEGIRKKEEGRRKKEEGRSQPPPRGEIQEEGRRRKEGRVNKFE